MERQKEITQEQLNSTEKMCQFLQGIKDPNRQDYLVTVALTYINGIEHGVAMERQAAESGRR